ncbi:MAG: HlyD family efflux transporter periplasmic adaptor subunit, partial [Pirellulales bacterium]|nr:HlyD family efflux transporter periplasmic adaptor subunit [Pirellulales bacterium]
PGKQNWMRRSLFAAVLLTLFGIGVLPVPLKVYSTATLRPANVQTLAAPRDATVDQIHVVHGQSVHAGDLLVTMADPVLDQQITSLLGRRAVLAQKQTQWTHALVDSKYQPGQRERAQDERRLIAEEILSIDEQLAVLNRMRESLQIRADRDGIVDAWQAQQRLHRRPLRRGDPLLQVIGEDSPWLVDVRVDQSRVSHLQDAQRQGSLRSTVSLIATPETCWQAAVVQVGPALAEGDHASRSQTAVLLRLDASAPDSAAAAADSGSVSSSGSGLQPGAPARVMFHCGTAPVAYQLFQDLIRSTRGALKLYFSSAATSPRSSGDQ